MKSSPAAERTIQFTEAQAAEIYRCIIDTLEGEFELGPSLEKRISAIKQKIEDEIPELKQLLHASAELQNAENMQLRQEGNSFSISET